MPTATTLPTFGALTGAAATGGAVAAQRHALTTPPPTALELTPGLAKFRFKTTSPASQQPAKNEAPKHKGNEPKGTVPVVENGKIVRKPVSTRAAVLQFIASLSSEPERGSEVQQPGLWGQLVTGLKGMVEGHGFKDTTVKTITLPYTVAGVKGAKGSFKITATVHNTINTIARHVLRKPTFTISTSHLAKGEWDKITASASTRLHELRANVQASNATKERTTSTGTITGAALYTAFIKTYQSGAKGSTPSDKTLTTAQVWNQRFVDMQLIPSLTAPQATAEKAYKQVLTMAAKGDEKPLTVIQTQIKTHAATLAEAQNTLGGTALSGQALAQYYVTAFKTLAHHYLVPMSTGAINQQAAVAAATTGTTSEYEQKANVLSAFKESMQKQAASLYSTFATQINKGVTTQTLLDPYAEVAAKTLGFGTTATGSKTAMDALGITWLQPKWNPAVSGGKAATGKLSAPMSLTQWRQHLITTPQYGWDKTATAQQMKLNVGQQLAQTFGLRKL